MKPTDEELWQARKWAESLSDEDYNHVQVLINEAIESKKEKNKEITGEK